MLRLRRARVYLLPSAAGRRAPASLWWRRKRCRSARSRSCSCASPGCPASCTAMLVRPWFSTGQPFANRHLSSLVRQSCLQRTAMLGGRWPLSEWPALGAAAGHSSCANAAGARQCPTAPGSAMCGTGRRAGTSGSAPSWRQQPAAVQPPEVPRIHPAQEQACMHLCPPRQPHCLLVLSSIVMRITLTVAAAAAEMAERKRGAHTDESGGRTRVAHALLKGIGMENCRVRGPRPLPAQGVGG